MPAPSHSGVYFWRLGPSRIFRAVVLFLLLCVATLLYLLLPPLLASALLLLQLALFAWAARQHHALWGYPLELRLSESQLCLVRQQGDNSVWLQPLHLRQGGWLGASVFSLTATLVLDRPKRWRSRQRWLLLLLPDNSSAKDRQRLARWYYSRC